MPQPRILDPFVRGPLAIAHGLAALHTPALRPALGNSNGSGWSADQLTRQLNALDPGLDRRMRRSARRALVLVELLIDALERFNTLEGRMETALDQIVAPVGDEFDQQEAFERAFAELAERLGVAQIRQAFDRLADAHPDQHDRIPSS